MFSTSAALPPAVSHLGALALTLSYVGSLYLTKPERKRRAETPTAATVSAPALDDVISQDIGYIPPKQDVLDRDHPVVIKSRIRAVSVATLAGMIGVGLTVGRHEETLEGCTSAVSPSIAFRLQLTPPQLKASASYLGLSTSCQILPCILAPLLFVGPLYTTFLERSLPFQQFGRQSLGLGSAQRCDGLLDCLRVLWTRREKGKAEDEKTALRNLEQRRWIELRNYIAVSRPTRRPENILMHRRVRYRRSWSSGPASLPSTNSAEFPPSSLSLSPRFGSASVRFSNMVINASDASQRICITHMIRTSRAARHPAQHYKHSSHPVRYTFPPALPFLIYCTVFQFTYTTLFGWFASYLFVKTGMYLLFCSSRHR